MKIMPRGLSAIVLVQLLWQHLLTRYINQQTNMATKKMPRGLAAIVLAQLLWQRLLTRHINQQTNMVTKL